MLRAFGLLLLLVGTLHADVAILKGGGRAAGKVVDVALEAWAIFVVTAVAGSFASFFSSGDSR